MEGKIHRNVPFFRLLIPFVFGILCSPILKTKVRDTTVIVLFLILLSITLLVILFPQKWKYKWAPGLIIIPFLFTAGTFITNNFTTESRLVKNQDVNVIARITEPPVDKNSSQRLVAMVETVIENDAWVSVNEKVMLYFSTSDSSAKKLRLGSRVAIKTKFSSPPGEENPFQFNYSKYLAKNQIHNVAFVNKEGWIEIESQEGGLMSFAFTLREKLISTFRNSGIEGQNLAVVTALISGYKSLLDEETRRVYSASGAMHILAVSGLHVGILFFIISAALFFFDRIKYGKKFKAIILIAFLWFFAIFTGLSASVLRASLMFTLVIIGISFNRKTNIYNTLSASAFILLAFNPMLITDIGFQLSYFAVISIIFFYPYIYKLIYVRNKLLDKVWSLVAVSVAAQLGTFVPGLYYFSQFPNYFLLTNLFAIPLATVVLYLAVGIIVFSPLPIIPEAIGWLLNKTVGLLNYLIAFTESLPYSTTTGISISMTQALILALGVLFLVFFLEKRRLIMLYGMFVCIAIFFIEKSITHFNQLQQSEMIVFSIRGESAIGITEGKRTTFAVTDTANHKPWEKFGFNLFGYLNKAGITDYSSVINLSTTGESFHESATINGFCNDYGCWINFKGKTVFIPIGVKIQNVKSARRMNVDVIIITNKSDVDIQNIIEILSPNEVVIDSSVQKWRVEKIQNDLQNRGIKHHVVQERGAYKLKG